LIALDLHKRHGTFQIDARIVAEGATVTALFGRSGCGKTSIIDMVAGLVRPDAGRIVVDDRVLFDRQAGIDVAPERRRIGYVFQEGRLFPHFTVRGNLTYGMRLVPPAERFIGFDRWSRCWGSARCSIAGRANCRAAKNNGWRSAGRC
jgi:molybdate transport system ATP-binding protein